MKVYKVLIRKNRRLYSFILSGKAKVRYRINRAARPKVKGSLLMAFQTLEAAKGFKHGDSRAAIYLAEAQVAPQSEWPSHLIFIFKGDELTLDSISKHWSLLGPLGKHEAPRDTVFCTEITLLERVT